MKRINILILVICLILGLWGGQSSFAKDENIEPADTENKETASDDDYVFPLDSQPRTYSIFDYTENVLKSEIKESTIQTTAQVDEEAAFSRDLELTSDIVDFYPETSQYVARNNAMLVVKQEKMQMTANEIIIDQRNYEIIGIGNVKIVKDGAEYFGDYIRINTKKESSFFKNPILYYSTITINAKSATMYTDATVAKEGSALIKKQMNTILSTSRFGGVLSERFFDPNKQFDTTKRNYKVVSKNIIVKREADRTDVIMKKASIYMGKYKIGYSPNLVFATDKDVNYVETNIPEIGNRSRIGTFIAPSFVVGLPKASTLKVGPLFSLNSHMKPGVGGFARLSTPKSQTAFMYGSSNGKFLVNGKYDFTDDLRLQFVGNDYMDSGWMGGQMPNYGVELVHDKTHQVSQANMIVRNLLSAGFFNDDKDYGNGHNLTTMRYKWQMEAYNQKPLLAWERYLMLGYAYQHAFALYQTGERTGVVRAGPRLYTDLGRLYAEVTYFAAGQYQESPFYFDRYRYGKNNIRFSGQYYINKYLSVGYIASINISGRDYDDNWLTENQLVASVGTEDLKVRVGFDTVRNTTVVGLDMFLGSNKALVEFDEMRIEKFDEHSKSKKEKKEKKKTRL